MLFFFAEVSTQLASHRFEKVRENERVGRVCVVFRYRFRHDKVALVGVGEDASVSFRKTKQSVNNKM